jgi:hypothetical protein
VAAEVNSGLRARGLELRAGFAVLAALGFIGCPGGSSATGGGSGGGSSTSTSSTANGGGNGGSTGGGSTTINLDSLPLGDGKVSTSPQVGYVYSCQTSFNGQGAAGNPPWISDAGTFDFTAKVVVEGSVSWPDVSFAVDVDCGATLVSGNDLPDHATGVYPISSSDPAYQYDQNPNHIGAQSLLYALPSNPTVAASPSCLGGGPIGVLFTGAYLYDALDAEGRDALAHEEQDLCQGHPDMSDSYHYHTLTQCLADPGTGHSNLLGYALDGFGIYGNRGVDGGLLTDADLDECHGHTHAIEWNGQSVVMYHYHATKEYPYSLGCYRGTPLGGSANPGADGGTGAAACDGGCSAGDVCCPSTEPCAGKCVPNCNLGTTCPANLTCNTSLGICLP